MSVVVALARSNEPTAGMIMEIILTTSWRT